MTEQELNIKIGKRVAQLRKQNGISQAELAGKIDSEKQNISRLERGMVNPGIFFLSKIAQAFQISLSELLDFDE
jgi:transcriptional regulator with XRE-family HTH domain